MEKYNHNLRSFAKENRKSGNLVEVLVWNIIKKKQCGYQFNRQVPIGNYIADFLCKDLKLIIEIDGYSHEIKREHDLERENYLKDLGYYILRFDNKQVLKTIEVVKENIENCILMLEKTSSVAAAPPPL